MLSRGRDPSRRWRRNRLHSPLTAATCGRLVSIRGARSRFSSLKLATMRGSRSYSPACRRRRLHRRQLRGVLHGLGATPATPVTILSDCADGPEDRSARTQAPVRLIMYWIGSHLAMRVQHVAQAATLADATETDRQAGVRLTDASSGSDGVSGMVRSNGLWISSPKPSLPWTLQPTRCRSLSPRARWRASWAISRLTCPAVQHDDRLRDGPPTRRADFDGGHREHGAMAAASANECPAADEVVSAGRSFDAQGPDLRRQRHAQPGLCGRGALGPPAVSPSGLTTPTFWTVSPPTRGRVHPQ